jgi:hypothetical protein
LRCGKSARHISPLPCVWIGAGQTAVFRADIDRLPSAS